MKTIVWSQSRCSYCDKAKALLSSKGIEYEERLLGEGFTKKDLVDAVPGATTVPQIFLHGEFIGGYTELVQKLTKENT